MKKKKDRAQSAAQQDGASDKPDNGKSTSRKIRPRDLLITFLVFFVIFAFVGYLRGRSLRNRPDRLRVDIVKNLRLGEIGGKKVLAYQCEAEPRTWWDIDANQSHNLGTPGNSTETPSLSPALFRDETVTTAFLAGGSVASIFTVKELLAFATASPATSKLTNEGHIKLILAALLGTVSGYEVGYRIALSENSNCGDLKFYEKMSQNGEWTGDGNQWVGFERRYWELSELTVVGDEPFGGCKSSDPVTKAMEEDKLATARVEFLGFVNGEVSTSGHDIKSSDFLALDKYRQVIDEFKARCAY